MKAQRSMEGKGVRASLVSARETRSLNKIGLLQPENPNQSKDNGGK